MLTNPLKFRSHKNLPLILQSETTECGLACLAMVAGYFGNPVSMSDLRARYAISMKGASLNALISVATRMELLPRALSADLNSLQQIRLPAILHWDFNHFVVLKQIRGRYAWIHDPAMGERKLSLNEVSNHYTGVALELSPSRDFHRAEPKPRLGLFQLISTLPGLTGTLRHVLFLALALQIFSIMMPFFMQIAVDHAVVATDRDLLTVLGLGFLLLALVQVAVTALRSWLIMVLGTSLDMHMHGRVFSKLMGLPMTFFERRHLGDMISRFESLNQIQRTFTNSFIEAMIDGVMVLLTLVVMFVYSSTLALIVLAAALLYAILRATLYSPLRRASEQRIVYGAKQQTHFLETLRGIQSIKLFNREPNRSARYGNLMADTYNAGIRVQRLNILFQSLNGLLFGVENIVVIWCGALLVINGGFSVGMLFAFMAYKRQFIARIVSLIDKSVDFKMLGLHLERVSDIALAESEPDNGDGLRPQSFSLTLDKVSYRYSDSDPWTVHGVSDQIEDGDSLAIVGPSGCGKTTLLKLMLGMTRPQQGRILIGKVPLDKIDIGYFREQVASVMQNDQLFAGSILENITFFSTDPDLKWAYQCAATAAIHNDIEAMPMGYHTLIGDMGTVLSGGQKQRVLLARALYKRPKILFMDEATSHLDLENERKVNESIQKLNITTILIAHRPQTIASARKVIYLGPEQIARKVRQA